MSAKSYSHGWPIVFQNGGWVFADTLLPVDNGRPCVRCQRAPTAEGFDACLGYIPGATSACCGHGKEKPYVKFQAFDENTLETKQ